MDISKFGPLYAIVYTWDCDSDNSREVEFIPVLWEFIKDPGLQGIMTSGGGIIYFKIEKGIFEHRPNNGAYCKPFCGDKELRYDSVFVETSYLKCDQDWESVTIKSLLVIAATYIKNHLIPLFGGRTRVGFKDK